MNQKIVQFQSSLEKTPESITVPQGASLEESIIAVLRGIYDPEIPVNIYDLGLIYDIKLEKNNAVTLRMTLTSPHCPVAESLPAQVECSIRAIDKVSDVLLELVWDPPWDKSRMSEEARLLLDMY